ncbi:MAG TPA: type II toxin-antitoxin system VapC family toxin [Halothiobacillus sp.]|jgi:PIN domain nuclease of toxin-antitoxin system|nr:type II toxin-antitoxin system VapC family toxin [Halothiobacillus sp.]
MTYLLDTHILLWWLTDHPRLSPQTRALISNTENTLLVSAASAWEIATKQRIGKMPHLDTQFIHQLPITLQEEGFTELPISTAHALFAGAHPATHRDPFDRILAAQAHIERIPLISADPAMTAFGIEIINA